MLATEIFAHDTELSFPMDGAPCGRLLLPTGAANLTVGVGGTCGAPYRDAAELMRARFTGLAPEVQVEDGTVRILYPSFSFFDHRRHAAAVLLSPSIPWSVEIAHGASGIHADFRGLRVDALSIRGGAGNVRLHLGRPRGAVPIEIHGGVSRLEIVRPSGVPVVVRARGGLSDFRVDTLVLGALGADFAWRSPPGEDEVAVAERYEIDVSGGASGLHIVGDGAE